MKDKKTIISIIIANCSDRVITNMLQDIQGSIQKVPYEIILIGQIPIKSDWKEKKNGLVRVINGGGMDQRRLEIWNRGADYATGEYLVFLDPCLKVKGGWLESLLETIQEGKDIGIVGPKMVDGNGKLVAAGQIVWSNGQLMHYGGRSNPRKCRFNYVKEVDSLPFGCMLVDHRLWKTCGGFDLRFGSNCYGWVDLAFQARKLGYKVIYQPNSIVEQRTVTAESEKILKKDCEKFTNKWIKVLEGEHSSKNKDEFQARNRTQRKKTVVVVDQTGPPIDKQTAGRSTYHYIQLFLNMGMHVIFLGNRPKKLKPYTSILQRQGVEVLYGGWYKRNISTWIKNHSNYIDYVYLVRPHIAQKYIDAFKTFTKAKIIYNVCDLRYLRERRNFQITGESQYLQSSRKWKRIENELIEKCDVVHTYSSVEQQMIKKTYPQKTVRLIPVFIYDQPEENQGAYGDREGILFVGQFRHKPNLDGMKWFIERIFPKIVKEIPEIKLYLVGAHAPEWFQEVGMGRIIVTGYLPDELLKQYYAKNRLVIAPLRFGAGVKGKIVEALYHRVPVVTTSIGAEGLPNNQQNLIIADQENEFAKSVIQLYLDRDLWEGYSERSFHYIHDNFSSEKALRLIKQDVETNK